MQAEGRSSDCVLKPVAVYPDSDRKNGVLVMCEVMMPDGKTPHASNKRATILDDAGAWFGFEQEYFLYKDGRPLGFPDSRLSGSAGPLLHRRRLQERRRHRARDRRGASRPCLDAGINHEGINAEVAKGQWEFQIFGKGSKKAADEMWMARYLLQRLTRKIRHRHRIPLQAARRHRLERLGHARQLLHHLHARDRRQGILRGAHGGVRRGRAEHIAVYGPDNHLRLTGLHETQSIDKFSYGVADRGASIRVPHSFVNNGYKGYLEDRRPNSQGDPYQIASQILKTIASVPTDAKVSVSAAA